MSKVVRLPIVFRHIAATPDVHVGIGATVGAVIATHEAVIPSAVGVDIGERVCITRKGAVQARRGRWASIPGSMGARSYIVRGRGHPEARMPQDKDVIDERAPPRTQGHRRRDGRAE